MLDGGTNYGSRTWSGGTIGGAVFGPAGPLAARTTYGVIGHTHHYEIPSAMARVHSSNLFSLLPLTSQLWNGLPEYLVDARLVEHFRELILSLSPSVTTFIITSQIACYLIYL